MTQASEHDKKTPKERDDHHDDANPMPDTHHVNTHTDSQKAKDDQKKGH